MSENKNMLSLDDIRAAVEAKYVAFTVKVGDTDVRLMNVIRLPKVKRDQMAALEERLGKADEDQTEVLRDVVRLTAETPKMAKVLIDAAGDDLALLVEIFSAYSEATKPGEASGSRD